MPLPKFEGDEFEFPDEKEAKKDKKQTAAEDDFSFEIEDDTPEEDRGRKAAPPPEDPSEDELASYDEKVQSRIKKFTRGYHDERRAKEEALRERQAAEAYAKQILEENKRLQQQLATGSQAFIEQSKSSADIELGAAKKAYRDAVEAGDIDAQADAQANIARAMLKVEKAQGMKPIEMEEKDDFKPAVEESAKPKLAPRTQKWIETNSDWYGVDDEMTMTALGLDKKLARQYGPDYVGTKEYFDTIDKTMRKRFPEHFEDVQSHEEDEEPPKRSSEPADEETPRRATKPANVVAPASRSTPPNRVRLKASEAAIARRLGVPLEQYAKQVALLRKGE
jgi:hypothetical protein